MKYAYSDGGRSASGFAKAAPGDCAARAIAIASGLPYREVYEALRAEAQRERPRAGRGRSNPRRGVRRATVRRYLEGRLGWRWVPTMQIGQGCRTHLRADELPAGPLIANCSKHLVACCDGICFDVADPRRGGKRCVYGYWQPPADAAPGFRWPAGSHALIWYGRYKGEEV